MGIAGILKLVGLCKVNQEYLKSVDEKLEDIEGGLSAAAEVADSGSQIVEALNAGDKAKAVEVALEFCKIDDEVKELKEIQTKVKGGESITTAVAAANGPLLTKELVDSTTREVADSCEKMSELPANITSLGEEVADKLKNIKSAAASWSLAEKVGTPGAVHSTAKKAKKVGDSAKELKEKLEALKESISKIKT